MRFLIVLLLLFSSCAWADFSHAPQVPTLLSQLKTRHGFDAAQIAQVKNALKQAQFIPRLIHNEQHAKEKTLSWDAYRPIAVNPRNIENGVKFMHANQRWLAKAEAIYGVPPEVVTAIIGVETKYGRNTGHARALDALATMAFKHPTRGKFFLAELEAFFVLCRNDDFTPTQLKSSYAGALGMAQFMPDNYLRLGVDFDGDGKIDLWSAPDAIGSIANYLAHYDNKRSWVRGEPLIVEASSPEQLAGDVSVNARHIVSSIGVLSRNGIVPAHGMKLPPGLPASFIRLDGAGKWTGDWIALQNFYSVMSYNPRVFYAMAVTQLAHALVKAE